MQDLPAVWNASCLGAHTQYSKAWPNDPRQLGNIGSMQTRHPTRVGMVAPAEDTLVGTGKGGSGLHAAVRLNAVEAVLVAAAPPPQHGLGPPAQLHPTVRACRMHDWWQCWQVNK